MTSIREKWQKIPVTLKASGAYAVCSILQRCISFFTMPIFAKRLLTTEQYGDVTLYNTWSSIITIILTLNLAYGSFSTAMVKFEKDRDGYISSVQGIFLYLTGLFVLIYLPFRKLFNTVFEMPTWIVLIMFFDIITNSAWSLWAGKKRFEFKWKEVVAASLVNSILSPVLALFIVLNIEERGYGRIIGFAAVTLVFGGYLFIANTFRGKKLYKKEYWEYALSFNIPLIAYYLSQTIFNMSDRLMIDHIIDKGAAAVYGVACQLATVRTFVLNAINNSYVPWFYGQLKEGKQKENRSVTVAISVLMSLLLCGVIWYAPEIILLWAGEKYTGANYVVLPVAVSILLLFYSQLFINVEFFYERKKELVWASIGSALVNIVLNWWLIPYFGIVAAGYTTLASYVLFAICNYIAMKKVLKEKNMKDDMYDYKLLLAILGLFCIVAAGGALLYSLLWVRIVITVIVLIVMVVKRNYFIDMYKKIKGKK